MGGMSERKYAARIGLSRSGVLKARATGRLVINEDGTIDPEASDERYVAATDPAQSRRGSASGRKPVNAADVTAVSEALREDGISAPSSGRGATFLQARTAHEVLKAQERRVKLQQLKSQLVDRSRATALVYRLAREERDAWATWPARVAAEIAAEVGVDVDRLQRALERRVREQLASLSEPRLTFGSR
jgi:hypothetical protein